MPVVGRLRQSVRDAPDGGRVEAEAEVAAANLDVLVQRGVLGDAGPPQVGVVVAYTGADAETAKGIAQHISFADPEYLTREDVPAEAVEKERQIVEQISREEGKPEAALPKIIEGRLGAFFKQVALLDQDYAKDNKLTIAKVLSDAGLTVTDFARFKVGA